VVMLSIDKTRQRTQLQGCRFSVLAQSVRC
jgi:hypothetical protein